MSPLSCAQKPLFMGSFGPPPLMKGTYLTVSLVTGGLCQAGRFVTSATKPISCATRRHTPNFRDIRSNTTGLSVLIRKVGAGEHSRPGIWRIGADLKRAGATNSDDSEPDVDGIPWHPGWDIPSG